MDRLVCVDVNQLEIEFRPGDRSTARLAITSLMHTMSVAVHLTTTRPNSPYSLSPVTLSLLPPLSSASFTLTLTSPADRPPVSTPAESLVVRSVIIPAGKPDQAALCRRFALSGVHVFKDATIPIFLVGPHVLDHLLLSETLESSFLFSRAISTCSPADISAILLRSAAAGNARYVSELLSAGADPDSRGPDNRSALSLAVSSGDLATVERLVAAGASVFPHLDLVFHESVAANRTDITAVLERSARKPTTWADSTDSSGRTPLHYAAANGHNDSVKLCLKSGCGDPDRADSAGWTPLHLAASGGFLDVVESLIDASAYDPKVVVTADKKTAFGLAAEGGHSHLYDVLGLGDDILRAASTGDMDKVRRCLLLGVDLDRRDQNGWTALHRAAFKGRTKIVEFLIDNGARMDVVDDVGFTPLRCAAEAGRRETARVLIDRGAMRQELKGIKSADLFRTKLESFGAKDLVVSSLCVEGVELDCE